MTKRHRKQGMDPLSTLTSAEDEIIYRLSMNEKEADELQWMLSVNKKLNENKPKKENED